MARHTAVLAAVAALALVASASAMPALDSDMQAAVETYLRGAQPTSSSVSGLGNGLWRTFGFEYAMPYNVSGAESAGWVNTGGSCDSSQGLTYSETKDGASHEHPLQLMFTSAGQLAGFRVTIYGDSWTSKIGPAAQPSLVKGGYWIVTPGASSTWYLTLSTRSSAYMCSGRTSSDLLGDQLVINQGSLNFALPLTAKDAQAQGYAPGSCMKTMGQHWMLDLSLKNGEMSWVAANLLPVVPMYYPPTIDGTIHAVFFTTPVAQPGSAMFGQGDWETPALTASLMCQNFCLSGCKWNTNFWSTMHVYFDSNWKTATCPGGSGIVGRSCPKD